jgi:predicted HAD superfamily Cof-like phosphohydrolase
MTHSLRRIISMKTIGNLLRMPANKWVAQVEEFNREKLPFVYLPVVPTLATPENRLYFAGSVTQEHSELVQALSVGNLEEIVDGAVDTIYVLLGILLAHGVDPTPFFEDVHRSNMDKRPAIPGTMGRGAAGGKSMKPENWVKPRVAQILEALKDGIE